jgi:hypothetical protein
MSLVKKYHPTAKVFTGPTWLMDQFNGFTRGASKIEVVIDPDGKPIIGTTIATDITWDLQIIVNGKPLIEWLEEIPYCYYEDDKATYTDDELIDLGFYNINE